MVAIIDVLFYGALIILFVLICRALALWYWKVNLLHKQLDFMYEVQIKQLDLLQRIGAYTKEIADQTKKETNDQS